MNLNRKQYFRAQIAREMLGSEEQRYSKFKEPIRARLQRYPLLTEYSFPFNSYLHINRVLSVKWLYQGKANAIVWMDDTNFF